MSSVPRIWKLERRLERVERLLAATLVEDRQIIHHVCGDDCSTPRARHDDPVYRAAQDVVRDVEQRLYATSHTHSEYPIVSVSLHEITKLKSLLKAVGGQS